MFDPGIPAPGTKASLVDGFTHCTGLDCVVEDVDVHECLLVHENADPLRMPPGQPALAVHRYAPVCVTVHTMSVEQVWARFQADRQAQIELDARVRAWQLAAIGFALAWLVSMVLGWLL